MKSYSDRQTDGRVTAVKSGGEFIVFRVLGTVVVEGGEFSCGRGGIKYTKGVNYWYSKPNTHTVFEGLSLQLRFSTQNERTMRNIKLISDLYQSHYLSNQSMLRDKRINEVKLIYDLRQRNIMKLYGNNYNLFLFDCIRVRFIP